MLELVVRPVADAFMQVGVFVALLVVPFGWARYRWGSRLDELALRHRRLGPLLAALATVPPGCGGAIVVVAAYARGAVSYGAAVSALVATTGDACWVLLAHDPVLTLQLKVLLVVTGTVTGHLVDALGISPRLRGRAVPVDAAAPPAPSSPAPAGAAPALLRVDADTPTRPTATAGPTLQLSAVGPVTLALWAALAAGLVVSLPVTFRVVDPAEVGASLLRGVDPYLALGAVGTVLCLVAFLGTLVPTGRAVADDDTASAHPGSLTEVVRHGAHEVAFVTVWVAAVYLVWSLVTHLTGFDGSQLPVLGLAGVVIGALVGLVPGCAVQIVFAGIFAAGGMPLSTLVANTISQDGDALIPLLALEHRSALLATVLTTVPALVVGTGLLLLA
ncbi:putative manganese transporter [Nocardioides aurantiacus]|uniref:putative manganese transporter n=1 Tax=Nocardioides aurantiacus TaxID=86796 RepID=UPI00403F0C52